MLSRKYRKAIKMNVTNDKINFEIFLEHGEKFISIQL